MSLHKFAEQVAANGRGEDSLLVHMTPDEVRNLQKFAQANGTTLTINPTTGLPEAGMLSDLFKAVAPIALGAFLGPAGFGLSSMMAGVATGGITALATGSLSRGLMAGLGAYGGAGLGESLMTAGGGMSAANAATAAQGQLGATNLALGEALPAQAAEQFTKDAVARMAPSGAVSAGFNAATASPTAAMNFAKNNLSNIGMAAAPLLAMQPTTKMPDPKDTGYIRQFDFNINPDTGKPDPLYGVRAMTPVKASEFGNKTFQGQRDLFRQQNPNPYELGVGSLNQPPQQQTNPMAGGGIVALAEGGPTYQQYSNEEINKYLTDNPNVDIAAATKQFNADPTAVSQAITKMSSGYLDPAQTVAGSGAQKYYDAFTKSGIDANELFAAEQAQNPNYAFDAQTGEAGLNALKRAFGVAKQFDTYEYGKAGGTNLAKDVDFLKQYDAGNFVGDRAQQIEDIARETGLSLNDVARRYDAARASTAVKPPPSTGVNPDGYYGSGPVTGVDYRGNTVSIATPGDIITNPDGSRTVVPNIPGRPTGGFTGIEELKSRYTAGGGSLGYTSKAPKNLEEFNELYNTQTGDSLAAYDYLMGKGAGTANAARYPIKSVAPRLSQNYNEFALGKKTVGLKPLKTTGTGTGTFKAPQTYFNETEYLAANPDVAAELKSGKSNFTSAYEHYLLYGQKEGRPFTGDYDSYLSAIEADKAKIGSDTQQGGGADAPGPGPDASSPANDAPGTTTAKDGGMMGYAMGGGLGSLGSYSDGGRLLKGPGDGVSDSIPATIGRKQQPARLADGEFVVPARIVSELGNGSTDAGAKKLYAMMDRVQRARGKTTGKNKVAANSRADKYLPA
jgi:hypothetical protein